AAVNSGVQNAQPPAPTPVAVPKPPEPLQPIPLPPKIVTPPQPTPPPTPTPTPTPSLLDRVEKIFTPSKPEPTVTPDTTPVQRQQAKPQQNNINVNTQMVKRTKQKNTPQHDNSQAYNNAARSLSQSLSSSTKVDMPGTASASYASYASVVETVYERALRPNLPDQVASNSENTKVSITVASDGTVISAHIISPSGDSAWDGAVQRTLDQVTTIEPFPEGSTDKERHYTLSFNPEVEKSFQ
ncbi:MAG TPA: TonB family protein, partial [Pseudomonadales bacterium]|nr:TonB family protein [Pseudomonadales bacterium]